MEVLIGVVLFFALVAAASAEVAIFDDSPALSQLRAMLEYSTDGQAVACSAPCEKKCCGCMYYRDEATCLFCMDEC